MAARLGPRGPEGYPTSATVSPQSQPDSRDPFNSPPAGPQRRYYDNDSEEFGRNNRDTYTSDSSQGPHDSERYYDNNGYDSYSMCYVIFLVFDTNSCRRHRSPRCTSRYRLGRRIRKQICTLCGVVWSVSRGLFRLFSSHSRRVRGASRSTRSIPSMDRRTPNTTLEGGNRGYISRSHAKVRVST